MELAQVIAVVITAIGGTVIIPRAVQGLWAKLTGRATRDRKEIDRLSKELDTEAAHRRRLQEDRSRLVRMLTEAPCVDPTTIPDYPR